MLAIRLSRTKVTALTGITLRSGGFQQKRTLFAECNGAQTSHSLSEPNPEKHSNSPSERNCEKYPILRVEPGSNKKPELRAGRSLDKTLNVPTRYPCVGPSSGHAECRNGEFNHTHGDPCTDESSKSEVLTLWASYRVRGGKLQELRKDGMVPGIVSDFDAERGTNYNYYIALQRKEIWGHLTRMGRKDFMSRFYNLALRDRPDSDQIEHTVKVYPSKLYLIEGRRSILNVAFVRVRRNVKLRMMIPLKFRGRTVCPGLIKGGTLVVLKKALSLFVFPDEVPPYIEVDVSKLNVGERILVNDLDLDLQYRRQAGHVVCEVKKYGFVRPNRSRSLARSSPDIGPPKYHWIMSSCKKSASSF